MPRGPRLDSPGTLHHVMIRGINKCQIFNDDDDRLDFLRRMGFVAEDTSTFMYAFALMGNHVHLLIKSSAAGLPTFMRRQLTGYALYYNRRHDRVGHLFQNRYKSVVCEEEHYFRKLVAYIHLNPLRGGLVGSMDELASYPWCGHQVLLGRVKPRWFDRNYVLGVFGRTERQALRSYTAYMHDEQFHDREDELDGGGLQRSQLCWSEVSSRNVHGNHEMSDARILGSGEFVKNMLSQVEKRIASQLHLDERIELARLDIESICRETGISASNLRSGGRYGALSKVRMLLVDKLVNERELTLAETARQLGVSTSAVNQIMEKINYMMKDGSWKAEL
ncbi:MAG: hypothetical protein HGB29_09220 [Chlorobiaceae bacterium]|nr:hypothetical protein [Chlorobiaceae bacterium]NTW75030.1 hypothetical protein [Chlorobiaceae bacterium]